MKKQEYQKPSMKVVQLHHRTHLLQVSGVDTLSGKKGEDSSSDTWRDLE